MKFDVSEDVKRDDVKHEEKDARPMVAVKMWKKAKEEYRLLEYHACPEYMKDNEYILSYYRVDFSWQQALSSLFKLHNETLNIWTHLLGFLLFLILTVFTAYELGHLPAFTRCVRGLEYNSSEHCLLQSMRKDVTNMMAPMLNRTTRWPFFVFMGGSMFCLLANNIHEELPPKQGDDDHVIELLPGHGTSEVDEKRPVVQHSNVSICGENPVAGGMMTRSEVDEKRPVVQHSNVPICGENPVAGVTMHGPGNIDNVLLSQVYERSSVLSGGEGTLISLFPNGCKALNEASPDVVQKMRALGILNNPARIIYPDGTKLGEWSLSTQMEEKYGQPLIAILWKNALKILGEALPEECKHFGYECFSITQV
ncbi:hypothetical protein L7F22_008406 [Adiantum nelumboides]|nr:hypothetical protein [Adiantum nelumboides]